jgi:hypothetical protein
MPGKECLDRFFHRLLAVKRCVSEQRRLGGEIDLGSPEVVPGAREPGSRVRNADGISCDKGVSPRR